MEAHNRLSPSLRWEGMDDDQFLRVMRGTGGKGETSRTDDGLRSEVRGSRNFERRVTPVWLGVLFAPIHRI